MSEDISMQVLSQASESIQRLFDLSTRIDERVKVIKEQNSGFYSRLDDLGKDLKSIEHRLTILETQEVGQLVKQMNEVDKRVSTLEQKSKGWEGRWNVFATFIIQLVWITLAAWILFKLHLNPPPVP